MVLGEVVLDGLVGSDTHTTATTGFLLPLASDPPNETNYINKWWYGSGSLKQHRSATEDDNDDWRSFKLVKTTTTDDDDDDNNNSISEAMLFQHQRNNHSLLRSNATLFSDAHNQQQQQQMLSFSSPKSEQPLLVDKTSPNSSFPYSFHPLSSYNKNTGYKCGNMHGMLPKRGSLFTPSQWMELEQQALIYKYIAANVAIPSHLLIPIKKALESAAAGFHNGFLRPNAMGWGGYHLGLGYSCSNNKNCSDPEPGRCRRTDGKKWRCSRDAVVDQKYCERHLNRGRHRSRKPVEQGQSGQTSTETPTTTTTTTTEPNHDTLTFSQHQPNKNNNLHLPLLAPPPNNINSSSSSSRMFMSNTKGNGIQEAVHALPMLPPKENPFMIHKQQRLTYEEESSRNDFGLVTCDSLLNPSHKASSTLITSSRGLNNPEIDSQHSLRHFIDDWPKTQSSFSWPELDMQSESTELSISISSPTNEKVTLSPLRPLGEFDPIQMCLGVGIGNGNTMDESNSRQTNWIPITWENSMGGPLGEALNVSNIGITTNDCVKNSSALNLMGGTIALLQ